MAKNCGESIGKEVPHSLFVEVNTSETTTKIRMEFPLKVKFTIMIHLYHSRARAQNILHPFTETFDCLCSLLH